MRFAYSSVFPKTIKNLNQAQKENLFRTFRKFESGWEEGLFPHGLGIKHLRKDFFEFRVDLHNRIVYEKKGDLIHYLLYGNHNEIQLFLKRV